MAREDDSRVKWFKVKVHRANVEPENSMLPITVNVIGSPALGGKKVFSPGQTVELTAAQINVLKTPVETSFVIPDTSGIYEERNPIQAARQQYPDFEFKHDRVTGSIVASKSTPNYFVEHVEGS